ncbi:isopentenyl-diphosphate Delta-isomerase [Mycobacterium kyogaense]|uniref:isopentenyl-diphosphate Delta-isomerase n=1 Tax=Mycobacterium kyogaense TaxID=2212479 RepID=UPI003FA5C124
MPDMPTELVVLVDDDGRRLGSAPKAQVHHESTPLHLAFSCYLFDDSGNVLLTRRALHKRTFAGIWTNSCCGHPAPDESMTDAVHRRVREELGVGIAELTCVLPDFRYYAVAADGVAENELCPVYCGRVDGPVRADADEVMDQKWVPWEQARTAARLGWAISPWAVEQIPLLDNAGVPRSR